MKIPPRIYIKHNFKKLLTWAANRTREDCWTTIVTTTTPTKTISTTRRKTIPTTRAKKISTTRTAEFINSVFLFSFIYLVIFFLLFAKKAFFSTKNCRNFCYCYLRHLPIGNIFLRIQLHTCKYICTKHT